MRLDHHHSLGEIATASTFVTAQSLHIQRCALQLSLQTCSAPACLWLTLLESGVSHAAKLSGCLATCNVRLWRDRDIFSRTGRQAGRQAGTHLSASYRISSETRLCFLHLRQALPSSANTSSPEVWTLQQAYWHESLAGLRP